MSDQIDIGNLRLPGGYFFRRQGKKVNPFKTSLSSMEDVFRFVYTYKLSETSIKNAVLDMISKAQKKIFIASFLLGDTDLIRALIEAADRLRGGVYIITAIDENSLEEALTLEGDENIDIQVEKKRFEELTQSGIYIRGHSNCHAKFIVVDDNIALVSSANMNKSGFIDCGECGVAITDHNEVNRIARFFVRLWYSGCNWEVPPGRSYSVQTRSSKSCPCSVPLPLDDTKLDGKVIWTDGDDTFTLNAIHNIIKHAKKEIILSTYKLNGMTEEPALLLDPLRHAVEQKGIKVKILVRRHNESKSHRIDTATLAELGVEIFADEKNHAKGIIADQTFGALFSANFDAKHGLTSGVEVGVRLDGRPALKDALSYFDHAMSEADWEFKLSPDQSEMNAKFYAKWHKQWPLDDKLYVTCSPEEWNQFKLDVQNAPVLYKKEATNAPRYLLLAGTSQWELLGITEKLWGLHKQKDYRIGALKTMDSWLKLFKQQEHEMGFCASSMFFTNQHNI